MDAEVDSETGPCNGSPDLHRPDDDRTSSSSAEASVADQEREACHEDERSQHENTSGENKTELEQREEGTPDLMEPDDEDIEHLIEEVEEDEDEAEKEEEEDVDAEEEEMEEDRDDIENEEENERMRMYGIEKDEEEEEIEKEEDEEEPVESETGERSEEEPHEDEEEAVEKEGNEVEKEGFGKVNDEPDSSPEMGDDYDEHFVAIPVECDLQEDTQGTAEKQESGSNYSAEEAEDSNDEDYRPKARWTRSRKSRRDFDDDLPEETNEELRDAYRIFLDVTVCAGTHFLNHPTLDKGAADYMDIIEKPMWLEEMKQRFLIGEYSTVQQFVTDLRLILVNCYRFYGRDNPHSRRALKIEQLYSQKVAALPEEERRKFKLDPEATEEEVTEEGDSSEPDKSPPKKEFSSFLLERFGGEKEQRGEERRNALIEERKLATSDNEKQKLEWERETLFENDTFNEMKSMWEIPQISQILQLTRSSLCMEDLPQYEVERMLLMPQSSKLLAVLMTSLLSPPISRPKLQTVPPMPYSIWSKKLVQRVAFWYKSYNHRNKDPLKAFQYLGIEAQFWSIMGDWNQLEDYEFFELSFHQRVWVIKSLIDYLMHHHKTMHDILGEHYPEDQICTYLGEDKVGRQYLYFPIFHRGGDAVRVYRQRPHIDNWAPDPPDPGAKPVKTMRARQTRRGGKKFRKGSSAKRKEKKKQLYDFRNLHFISRNTYRMPYSLHGGRKGRKRRGKLPEVTNLNSDKPEPDVPFEENADCSATNSPEVSQDGQGFRLKSRRSTRSNKYQANYLDWSDSEDGEGAEPSETKTPVTRSKRAFSTISEGTQHSKSDDQTGGDIRFASVPESSIADDATQDASLLSDDNASRSSLGKGEKGSVKGEESDGEEDDDDDMPDISPSKIEEYEEDASWLTKSTDKKETRRPRYDPTWLLPVSGDFELVADSIQGIRDLIDGFSDEDDMDLMHRINNSETKTKRTPEQKLKRALLSLVEELEPVEHKFEKSARLVRNKMYNEWFEWRLRGEDFKDSAEIYWLSLLDPVNALPPVLTPQIDPPIKVKFEIKKEEMECNSVSGEVENSNAPSEATTQSEEANAEGEGRHTRRSKRRVESNGISGDSLQSVWPDEMSTEEERESDHDDSWEMPSKRKRKRTKQPKKRLLPKEGQEEGEEQPKRKKKKANDKTALVKKRLWSSEDADKDKLKGSSTVSINDGLHSKLTLDKQGNLFITMSSGERIPLEKDEEEKIKVPDSLPKFAVLNGKTLQQLFGENRVIPKAVRRKECSTTLFPALPMQSVFGNRTGAKDEKEAGTSGSPAPIAPDGINDPNIDVMKLIANKVTIQKSKPGEQRVYPPSAKPKPAAPNAAPKKDKEVEVIATKNKSKVDADVVYLSDGSDDSIELIQESTPSKAPTTARRRDGIPRIQKVVGNAKIDLPASAVKNISKSVTMSPVLPRHVTPTKNTTPTKEYQWKPVITNSRSLNAAPTRMAAPGGSPAWKGQRQVIPSISPEVQITTTRKPTTQRNLSVYRTPNQAFVPVTSLTSRPAQSNFVPVNQFVPMNNQYNNSSQFQPVNNQFAPVNSPHFIPLNSQSMVQVNPVNPQPPRVRMLAGNTTITPLPTPGRAQPVQSQGSPALTGQIVLVNTDKGFSYAVKLADGGTIFLTPEQVAKIREANSGKLTTMVTLHTN